MDTIIDRVVRAAGRHEGPGDGIESGPFSAVVEVRALQGGRGAELTYVATAPDGSLLHEEHTILALDMWSGEPTLYVLCAELEGMGQLSQVSETTFTNGRDHESLQLRIELRVDGDTLHYIWSWGSPGDELVERSRATVARVD
jgi:hypothetical protein